MIIALAGRRIDEVNAPYKRFPANSISLVKEKLRRFFLDHMVTHLVCSGACGADLLAHDIAGEMGIRRTMILPFDAKSFRSTSVTDRPGEWGRMYDKMLKEISLSNLKILNYDQADSRAYEKTNEEILNYAETLGNDNQVKVGALIIWEGKSKDSNDTTLHFKLMAEKRSLRILEIIT